MQSKEWLIYGANGFMGQIIAQLAIQQGYMPILAGRRAIPLAQIANGLSYRVFDLEDAQAVKKGLQGVHLVLNCMSDSGNQAQPLMAQALAQGAHYLDLDSSIAWSECLHGEHQAAVRAGSVLLNGVGFESVAGDCLAALLRARLPDAVQLRLAFDTDGIPYSSGLRQHHFQLLRSGGLIREEGRLLNVPLAYAIQTINFAKKTKTTVHLPMSELYTAYISTEIPNIQTYQAHSMARIRALQQLNWVKPLLQMAWLKKAIAWQSYRYQTHLATVVRQTYQAHVWGEVTNAKGARVTASLTLPNIYDWTAQVAMRLVVHLLHQVAEGGYYTPSLLMGAGFIRHTDGVKLEWDVA